ncbi:MAG: alpha/beta hydrolase [Nocardioides sp.]
MSLITALPSTNGSTKSANKDGRIGRIIVASLAAGAAVATALVFAPFVPAEENALTGVVLLGSAVGWALLAGLSTWLSDQPQRWAAAPALFMGLGGGIVMLGPDTLVDGVLSWVWPPALLALVVWMFMRAKRELRSRSRVLLLYPVLAVLLLASLGGGYERIGKSAEAPTSAMPGQLVDVGKHRLHLECTGSRGPTVVLEPGGGAMSSDLGLITPEVARDTRVCVYDRPGRGWSDSAASPQDGAQIATDLHTLLHRADVPGPYVLAGHSFGGLYVMSFAAQYPQEVAGMVLVDSTAPTSSPMPPEPVSSDGVMARVSAMVSSTARLGVGRLIGRFSYSSLPPQSRDEARASSATAGYLGSFIDEFAVSGRSASEAGELEDLTGKPLVVLTAGRGSAEGWMAAQDEMATLSTNSLHRVVADATHQSLLADPDDAAEVTRAIDEVVVSVRTSEPLVSP